ncbi:phage holin family protein [Pseudomonas sp. NCCP-436]|uniref:phage holin family protein n=1 Tax=Pseudomonas sp. NCCP-436 TaxID=2842481 RepID=UPI001C7EB5ED|nr:phage holin family protein [Pseudomonas sp. NCCP-436]GIZ13898.1 membrane protein [Pseudomonas sp. NCCP-436]
MSQSSGPSPRRLAAALLGLLQGHLTLLSHELEDQRNQAMSLILLTGLALIFALLLLIGLSALLLILYWDSHRVLVAGGLCLFYGLAALGCTVLILHRLRHAEAPFSASLEELQRDREQLLP